MNEMFRVAMTPVRAVSPGRPARLSARFLCSVGSAYLAVLLLALCSSQRWGGAFVVRAVDDICSVVGVLFAAGCAAFAARSATGRIGRGWRTLALGLLAWAVGDVIWGYYVLHLRHDPPPYPSWADACYLLFLGAAGVSVAFFAVRSGGQSRMRLTLDGLIVAVSLFLVSWVGLLHGVVRAGADSRLALVVSLAYPAADVLIIGAAWVALALAYRASMGLLVTGLVTVALSNSGFTALGGSHSDVIDNLIDMGWFVASGLLALAALRSVGESPTEEAATANPLRTRLWLPYLPLAAAAGVVLAHIMPSVRSVAVAVGVLLLVLAVLARQFAALAENQRLLSDVGRLAFTDQLTGLANRVLFLDRVGRAVNRQQREPITLTVLCLDLDDFKAVNDQLGHPAGDELLIRVAERLSISLRSTDTVARLGGDEFAMLIEGPVEDAVPIAERILTVFATPIVVDGVMVEVRPSIGLTLATPEMAETTVEGLLRQADLAMYAAKRDGGGCLRSFVPDLPNPYELPRYSHSAVGAPATNLGDTDVAGSDVALTAGPETGSQRWPWPPRAVRLALLAVFTGWLVLILFCLLRVQPGRIVPIDNWLEPALLLASAAIVGARSWHVANERWAWRLTAAGMSAAGLANVAYSLWVREGQFPSVSDVLFVAYFPLALTGLVLMVRQRLRHLPVAVFLDVLIVGQTVAALATAFAAGPISMAATDSPARILITLVYPVGGLLLLALSAGSLAIFGWRTDARWGLLVAGFVLCVTANTVYLLEVAHADYAKGTWIDACFAGAFLLIATAAWVPDTTTAGPRLKRGRAPAHLSVTCALVVLGVIGLANGHVVPVILSAATLTAIAARIVVAFRDVSALAESHHQAMTDEVTGLANRLAVATALTQAAFDQPGTSRWDRRGAKLAMVLVALDQFDEIATSLGRGVSGELLFRAGARVSDSAHTADLVARVDDDQFAILLSQADLTMARAQAGVLMDSLRAPFALDHITVQLDAHIGIALWPDHCKQPQDLVRCAESAAAHAKTSTSHIAVYDAAADIDINDDGQLIADLRIMLTNGGDVSATGELTCYYQPKIRSGDNSVHSVEALVRWRHPERGLLAPDRFLPAAEHAGLMRPVAAQVLGIALAQMAAWRDRGIALTVAVNLSATNLLDLGLVGTIAGLLRKHELPADSLIVEITESTLTTDSNRARSTVAALRRLGARLSLDDYGTGWSSLARLQDLSVDELKLDRVFVARLARDPRSIAIVRSTVALAHSLGAELVAEGVEDDATLFALRQYGCTITQGHVHCSPLPADEFLRWLTARSGGSPDDAATVTGSPPLDSHVSTGSSISSLPIGLRANDK
jgi:diguanylate cyclase (GGDEF)-like protein